jgi:DMSO/TMAO reductase YedYZ molybdopterin-dependent catalytic subunit
MRLLRGRGVSDEERRRLPPGQHLVRNFPVLHEGRIPYTEAPPDWDLRVEGLVGRPRRWSLDEVRSLPAATVTCDIHCVTTWSKLDTTWTGVPMTWVLEDARVGPEVTHVIAHAEDGYSANLPIAAVRDGQALLAYAYEGDPVTPEHGGPLRLLAPRLYLWKSAKWLRALEFVAADRPGYWERLGYSMTADPWKEERYGF